MLRLSSQPIIFVIGFRQVEVWIAHGRSAERVELAVDLPTEPREWAASVRALDARLRTMLRERHVGSAAAVVLYGSPACTSQLTSVTTARDRHSLAAARLAALGAIGCPESAAVADACEIGYDASSNPPRRHLIAAADRDECVQAVADLVESLGLLPESITPVDAAAMMSIVRPALAHRGPTRGWVHVGEEQSWLVVVQQQHLCLFRPIRFGVATLVDVLTRPICIHGARGEFALTWDDARALLLRCGVPDRDLLLDEISGLHGRHVLPLLQPVLQRVIVELKQSLRFGLTDAQRRELTIHLCGQGAAIGGLATILGGALECPVEALDTSLTDRSELLSCGLSREQCQRATERGPNLLPATSVSLQAARRFNRRVWLGLAAGLALIALDVRRLDVRIQDSRERLASLSEQIDEAAARRIEADRLRALAAGWAQLENSWTAAALLSPDYGAVLREIAGAAPPEIRLTRLESANAPLDALAAPGAPAPVLTIEAYATGSAADESLAAFVARVRQSPLVESVVLGSTLRSELDGQAARRFEARMTLRRGREAPAPRMVDAGEEAQP